MSFLDTIRHRLFSSPFVVGQVEKALGKQTRQLPAPLKEVYDKRARHLPLMRYDEPSGHGPRKALGLSFEALRLFARQNPWLRAVVDIRKREVASSEWDILPDLDRHKKELDSLSQLVRSVRRFEDRKDLLNRFNPQYLDPKMVKDLIAVTTGEDVTDGDAAYRFNLALHDLTRQAEEHATPIRRLFEEPNRNGKPWGDILRAVVPDILVLDQGCIELRRSARPEGKSGWPRATNPILELSWVDGGTIRPCIDEHGILRGIGEDDPIEVAYEQWLQGQKTEAGGFRACDLLYIQENPQTDVRFRGYGFSRVESLVMTSMLEAWADKSDMEEFKREFYGGFLNIKDESFQPEDVEALRSFIEDELEGNKKLPITAFNDLSYVSANAGDAGRDKKSLEKLKRYAIRVCAIFEMPPVKIGIFENANYNTSQTAQDIADDGLRSLLLLIDDAINRSIVANFGRDDVRYKSRPDHNRDDKDQLDLLEQRQKMGIDVPNDTRAEFGKEPTEWGNMPVPYFSKYFEFKGQSEGGGGEMQGEDYDEDNEDYQSGEEGDAYADETEGEAEFADEAGGKEKEKGKPQPPQKEEESNEKGEEPPKEGKPSEIEKALVLGFERAVTEYVEKTGTVPHIEFEIED